MVFNLQDLKIVIDKLKQTLKLTGLKVVAHLQCTIIESNYIYMSQRVRLKKNCIKVLLCITVPLGIAI